LTFHTPINLETKSAAEGDDADAVKAALDALAADVETKTADFGKLTERLDAIETKLARPAIVTGNSDEPSAEQKAFGSYLRKGDNLPADEAKALVVSDDTQGGYLAPSDFQAEVIKGIVELSPVRQAARVSSTSMSEVILPKRTGRPTGSWVGETEDRSETGSTYGQVEIPVHEAACYVDVSLKLLEDSAVNIESELAFDIAEEFGRMEGEVFVGGNGVKKPLGFLNGGLATTPSGNASTLGATPADLLIDHLYSMPKAYRQSGVWMMNASTLASIRKLKDGTTGVYLWQPSYRDGEPETILGRPVIEAPDMPDVGAGTTPIAFGDFRRGYRIFDRIGLSIFADPYSQRTAGKVRFHARRRVGGGVVLGEAIKLIKCATA
jgi:HK97 family phage major capsid protein